MWQTARTYYTPLPIVVLHYYARYACSPKWFLEDVHIQWSLNDSPTQDVMIEVKAGEHTREDQQKKTHRTTWLDMNARDVNKVEGTTKSLSLRQGWTFLELSHGRGWVICTVKQLIYLLFPVAASAPS